YWAVQRFGADGGVQITGSHNPPEYNGFKMVADGKSFYGERIQVLKRRIGERDYTAGDGGLEEREVLDDYITDVARRFELRRPVRVVVDCGNGTGSLVAVELLERLVPKEGYERKQRWHPADAAGLVALLEDANPGVRRRALDIVGRAAPGDTPHLTDTFERLMRREDTELVSQHVIPSIYATEGPSARKQLAELAQSGDPKVRRTAESALKRLRSRQPHIDVGYRRAED
ncbi:MAG: HEAT repeat domain-containing protein, partial [Persicimonas sp.]